MIAAGKKHELKTKDPMKLYPMAGRHPCRRQRVFMGSAGGHGR